MAEPELRIIITDGPGNMPLGQCLQIQADAEREFGDCADDDCPEAVSADDASTEIPRSAT